MATQTLVSHSRQARVSSTMFLLVTWIFTVVDGMVLTFAFPLLYEGYGLMAGGLMIFSLGLAGICSLLKMWAIALELNQSC